MGLIPSNEAKKASPSDFVTSSKQEQNVMSSIDDDEDLTQEIKKLDPKIQQLLNPSSVPYTSYSVSSSGPVQVSKAENPEEPSEPIEDEFKRLSLFQEMALPLLYSPVVERTIKQKDLVARVPKLTHRIPDFPVLDVLRCYHKFINDTYRKVDENQVRLCEHLRKGKYSVHKQLRSLAVFGTEASTFEFKIKEIDSLEDSIKEAKQSLVSVYRALRSVMCLLPSQEKDDVPFIFETPVTRISYGTNLFKNTKHNSNLSVEIALLECNLENIWINDILPNWNNVHTKRTTKNLWRKGIPKNLRRHLWRKVVGNPLGITKALIQELKDKITTTFNSNEEDTEKSQSPGLSISSSGDLKDYSIDNIVQDINKRNKLERAKKSRKAIRRYIVQDIPRTFYKLELFLHLILKHINNCCLF
eukprot:TRINITY_DN772_c0_g3_i2.p1 TRINITY_DN772_c0_g3~~TRINITY_DN772_c0_g3_i2.p1  ORF type:complete len:415 (-),score=52.85 TRINITY_DN772_c0_g3_i2:271-1515(-)